MSAGAAAVVADLVGAGGVVLAERPGPGRTLTPLSEGARVGLGVGLAMAGRRVLVELEEAAGIARAADALADLATLRERSDGAWSAPVVVRVPLREGEAVPAVPAGIQVGVAAGDAGAMLAHALAEGGPTVVFEAGGDSVSGAAGGSGAAGVPVVVRDGGHATILACGAGVAVGLRAAETLAQAGVEVAVVDLRGVDAGAGAAGESARRTGRVVLVGPLGVDAVGRVLDAAFWRLESPPRLAAVGADAGAVVELINSVLEA